MVEFYKDNTMMWDYVTPWNQVGTFWSYSVFTPYYETNAMGDYMFKIYLDIGEGFEFLDQKIFSVL